MLDSFICQSPVTIHSQEKDSRRRDKHIKVNAGRSVERITNGLLNGHKKQPVALLDLCYQKQISKSFETRRGAKVLNGGRIEAYAINLQPHQKLYETKILSLNGYNGVYGIK